VKHLHALTRSRLCGINDALQKQGFSVEVMIQNGVAPTDPKVSKLRSGCRRSIASSSQPNASNMEMQGLSSQPTFDCSKAKTLTARVVCLDQTGALADWDLTSAYWARYFALAQDDRRAFEQGQERWLDGLNQICRKSKDQQDCVLSSYRKRAANYRSRLDGDALAESRLTPEQHAQNR